ncbi:MAG: hypothetical protein JNM36_09580 [Chitinophagales bacterium]|nr:hypothetical protein [Chitinophagales bacterium]
MTFATIALIAAIATLGLGLGFLFSSTTMLKQWGMQAPNEAKVMSRRIGAVYLGLSTMLSLARTSMPTTEAIAIGGAVITGLLAISGLYELKSGRVSKGILISTVVETLITIGFLSSLIKQ